MSAPKSVPQVKPGKENVKRLTTEEHALIREHFALVKATEQTLVANKERQDHIKSKITTFKLSEKIMQGDLEKASKEQLGLENHLTKLSEDYEAGPKADIRKRLNIPADKPFSFDPVTLEVTIGS